MLIFKFACDLGYWILLTPDTITYKAEFNPIKYVNGLLWCFILFWGIRHEKHKVSTFMLYLVFVMQIIPITTIYSMGNDNSIYYNSLCLSFLLCELFVGWIEIRQRFDRNQILSKLLIISFYIGIIFLSIIIVVRNGLTSLTALNIY